MAIFNNYEGLSIKKQYFVMFLSHKTRQKNNNESLFELNLLNYLLSFGVIWNNSVRLFGALSFGHLAELIFIR